jgi:hypothetical protein
MFGFGVQEFIYIAVIIIVLSATGLWPKVIRGMRELRGEHVEEPTVRPGPDTDLFYRLLGLSPSASWDEIERAYRSKAKIHHPDHGGDEDAMRTLNEVYTQLKKSRRS